MFLDIHLICVCVCVYLVSSLSFVYLFVLSGYIVVYLSLLLKVGVTKIYYW